MNIINGKILAGQIKDGVAEEVYALGDTRPMLAIIMVGERPDSLIYVTIKEREAKKVGIDTSLYRLDDDITEEKLISIINFLNEDESVDGILVQLPLPANINADKVVNAISPKKDIDGFTSKNLEHLTETDNPSRLLSPTYLAVLMCLQSTGIDLEKARVAIVAKPGIFGENLARLLNAEKYQATVFNPDTADLADKTSDADILITAAGQAGFIKNDYVKPGAIVIDIGINQNYEGQTVGDVDSKNLENAEWLTPVPGGVGPLTVAFALQNTLSCFHERHQRTNG